MEKSFTQQDIDRNMKRLEECFPHLTRFPYKVNVPAKVDRDKIKDIANLYDELAYPQHPNWTYCIPLFPNVEINGQKVDIGFHIDDEAIKEGSMRMAWCISANIVYSNEGQDYGSGPLSITSVYNKMLVMGLLNLEIITKQEIGNMILDFNGFMMSFMNSDLTGFDLEDFVETSTKNQSK
jgi:hypothetical protein